VPAELVRGLRALRAAQPDAARVELLKQRVAAEIAKNAAAGSAGVAATLAAKCLPVAFALVTAVTALTWLHAARRQPASMPAPPPARMPVALAPAPEPSHVEPALDPPALVVAPAPESVRKPMHRVRRARTIARSDDADTDALAPRAPPDGAAEMAVLWKARTSLEHDAAGALELTEQHASAYPEGVFAEEREVLAIEALLKLRRMSAALERAERFLQRYPDSTHARRLQLLIDPSMHRDP
jgi:hypothetical protein